MAASWCAYTSQGDGILSTKWQSPYIVGAAYVTADDIKDLLVSIHVGVITEAICFCSFPGLDLELMYDVVSNASGSSAIFLNSFSEVKRTKWDFKGVSNIENINA